MPHLRAPLTAPVVPNVHRSAVRRWLFLAAALVVVASIGVIVWQSWDSRRDGSTTDSAQRRQLPLPQDNPASSAVASAGAYFASLGHGQRLAHRP